MELDEAMARVTRTAVSCASDNAPRPGGPRSIELMHPPRDGLRSGGHVYNERLVAAARARDFDLASRTISTRDVAACIHEDAPPLRIWDSLFVESLASCDITRTGTWGVLLHYLPSQDPTLDRATRLRLERMEARVIEAASLAIVTGRGYRPLVESLRGRERVFVCEPGVSEPFLAPASSMRANAKARTDILTVANFLPAKGLVEALSALSRLRHIDWCWHVIGDRTRDALYTSRFDLTAQQLGLDPRIVRHGPLDHAAIARLMDDMDLFVFPSRYEAYGMALAEAAARHLPAVTTDVGAAASLYSHGTTGLIATVDDGEALSAHLERLMSDSTLRACFRENLRSRKPRTWQDTLNDFVLAVEPAR